MVVFVSKSLIVKCFMRMVWIADVYNKHIVSKESVMMIEVAGCSHMGWCMLRTT